VQAAVRLGDMQADRGDLDSAAGLYQRALSQQPNNADAALGLARVYSEKNENDKALPLLEQVLREDPTNMLAHFRLSALYRKMRRPEDAKRELAEYQKYKEIKTGCDRCMARCGFKHPTAPLTMIPMRPLPR